MQFSLTVITAQKGAYILDCMEKNLFLLSSSKAVGAAMYGMPHQVCTYYICTYLVSYSSK